MQWTAVCLDCGGSWTSRISQEDANAKRDQHKCPGPNPETYN